MPTSFESDFPGEFVTQAQLSKAQGDENSSAAPDGNAPGGNVPDESASGARATGKRRRFPHDDSTLLDLFRRMNGPTDSVRGGDRSSLRDRLVLAHTNLVEHCARAFLATGEPVEDLVQEGYIGLIKAVDRFDPDKGVRFSTYACHLISGEMRHYLRDLGKLIHEPGWHSQLRSKVVRQNDSLTQKLGRAPRLDELSASLDMQPQIVRAVLETHQVLAVESLDAPAAGEEDGARPNLEDRAVSTDEPLESQVENHLLLDAAMPRLKDLEQRAIRLFYYKELSKTEIARELSISVNYAAYLIKRGLENLRKIVEESEAVREVQAALPTGGALRLNQLAAWIEAETARTNEYAVLIFQIRNWDAATGKLNSAHRLDAEKAAEAITRRCCRLADKVMPLAREDLPGLGFVGLLCGTGEKGRRAGERWANSCTSLAIHPANAALVDALLCDYAFVASSLDSVSGDLVKELVEQL